MLLTSGLLECAASGVGLKATLASTATTVPVLDDHRVADLACGTSPQPEVVVQNQPTANTRATEDAKQVGSAATNPEPMLGHDAGLDVVRECDGHAKHIADNFTDRYRLDPACDINGLQDDACGSIDLAGRTNSDRGDSRGWLIGSHEQVLDRFLDRRKYGSRAARDRGCAPLAGYDRIVVGHEHRLDLCRTKIHAYAQAQWFVPAVC